MKINFLYSLILIVFFSQKTISQNDKIDSLTQLLSLTMHDTSRCEILSKIIDDEADITIWPTYNVQLKKIAEDNLKKNPNPLLKKVYQKYLADAYNNLGYLWDDKGDIVKALDYYHKGLKIQEQINDKIGISNSLNNIAVIYTLQGNWTKALSHYLKSLKMREETGFKKGIANSLNNISDVYSHMKNEKMAIEYALKGLKIQEEIRDLSGAALSMHNIAMRYIDQNKADSALIYLNKSLKISISINDKSGESSSLKTIGYLYFKQGDINKSQKYAEQSLSIAREIGFPERILAASSLLVHIYEKQNNGIKALKMLKLYIQMRDSLNNIETQKAVITQNAKYTYEKKVSEDNIRIAEEKKVIDAQLKQEKTQRIALFIGLIFVALFGGFMFNRFKVSQKQNILIQFQKTELQKQKELVEEHQQGTLDSIHYAKRIQTALMANSELLDQYFPDNFNLFLPKDIVSGDFYWIAEHKNKLYLAVCDSTGHGVPGAFMSLLNMGFLSEAIKEKEIEQPHEILNYVRSRLITSIGNDGQNDGMDAILICVEKSTDIEKQSKKITYSSANNEPILIRDNKIVELPKDRMPVGKGERTESFTLNAIELKKGESLYLYTDGYADQFGGPKGKKLKYKALNELLLANCSMEPQEQLRILNQKFSDWKGDLEQVDDVCIIGIKF